MAAVSYSPEPSEAAYYEALFRAADVKGNGQIGGAEAVQFFARSKLPVEILKSIWTVADQPSTSYLDHPKFAVALRLIQLTQNGQKGSGPNLAAPPGVTLRPVYFDGVSGASVPLPGQQQQQQQQPPPTPQRTQQYQQPPPTPQQQQPPVNSPNMTSATPASSRALVGPDPYSMTPQERARYEALFPQYAKPDGFVYGPEAVALFMKSGVDPATLRDIWNMVDRAPVDNRLDKLEFAIAMHLIVCISKKNLPLPSGGALPSSLLALKAAQSKPPEATTPTMAPAQQLQQPNQAAPPMSPMNSSQMPPPQQQQQYQQAPPSVQPQQPPIVETVQPTPMTGGPPAVQAQGGMSISDAFEGLSMGGPELSTAAPEPVPSAGQGLPSYVPEVAAPVPEPVPAPEPAPAPAPAPVPSPAMTPAREASSLPSVDASKYEVGDAHSELGKMKGVLQKLQAENISLKAQLGNMSEEEKNVQRELGAIVSEIGQLASELTVQRQKVSEAKNKLLEASAELKSHHEHKTMLTDLIAEAKQTEAAILDATDAIEKADKAAIQAPAPAQNAPTEDFLFGGYEQPSGQSAPAPAFAQTEAPRPAEDTAPPTPGMQSREIPEPTPPVQQSPMPAYGAPSTETAVAPVSNPSPGYQNYSAPAPMPATQQPESFTNNIPPQQQYSSHPTPTNLERPAAVAEHNRQDSGFGSGFVMGGSAAPLPQEPQVGASPAARTHSSSGDYGFEDEESFKVVEDLKKQAQRAAEAARDAEAASSKLAAEADELRTDADRADANARTLRAQVAEMKKGRFGGGKKKSANREAERAMQDATELRKRFMEVQTRAHDAQKLASDTRREANRLKDEAEKAEIEMASAASLRDQQKANTASAPTPAPAPAPQPSSGYGAPPANGYGYGQPMGPPEPSYGGAGYGYNNNDYPPASTDGGYAPGVMGSAGPSGASGGGFDLPSPNQMPGAGAEDPYSAYSNLTPNPF